MTVDSQDHTQLVRDTTKPVPQGDPLPQPPLRPQNTDKRKVRFLALKSRIPEKNPTI